MPLRACISTAAVLPSGLYIMGARDETPSSIVNLFSMMCYGCSVHSHWQCSVQAVVGRESPTDTEAKQVTEASSMLSKRSTTNYHRC